MNGTIFENHSEHPIAIVGGGLGGLALAIGLLKHGIRVHIYESTEAFSEIGAGVAFGINSITALHKIDPNLLEGYKKHATFNADDDRASTFMSYRWGMDGRKHGHRAGDMMWNLNDKWRPERAHALGVKTRSCIHRARLLDELVALLPANITSFKKNFVTAEEQNDGSLELHFADGTTAVASAIIGCDGIKSKVRQLVCGPDLQATYAGEVAYRAMVPRADAEKALGADLALNGTIYCGYGGYIVTYPVENYDFVNMVAIPHDVGETWSWSQDEWTVPATSDEIRQRFEGWYKPLIDIICEHSLPCKWALFDLQHNAPYCKGNMCLLGDSAHATTPHLGAGAGMAMEDAYLLSSLIASIDSIVQIGNAFRAYDAVRRPRTQGCIERSRNASIAMDFLTPEIADDTIALKQMMEISYEWLWHEDLELQLCEAKKLL
ncbi:mannitol 1-phosphate dehydrogenase [Didymella exigua CBS 183.55]|uniref:Mannitol 1-phosphate dehydrogenase n=1 Tax=Didymella exigua CBS 183.55 TaxID=1150837 RepID=A0A6A5RVU4_9PLEO|nr:mannitol 1-phosphate dehydrogenase [Didymella exigua CBS 183.55]KAF1932591.1 mannitol 1-phosphate dehydrogenase [Didymella exigua CBS 183.55]